MIELHQLSDYKGEEAIAIVCDLMPAVGDIVRGVDAKKIKDARNNFTVLGEMFRANFAATKEIIGILAKDPVDLDSMSVADASSAMFQIFADKEFVSLFGYQSGTKPKSSSAQASTEGEQ